MIEWILVAILVGATVGSFLNVVIYRYPLMLKAEWHAECHEFLEMPLPKKKNTFNLSVPRSHCPSCEKQLPFYCNIPLLSYLFLGAKCYFCKTSIPARYFFVELFCALISGFIVWKFGVSIQAAALLILTWVLIALAFIDLKHYLLPDTMTLPLLWLGLLCSTHNMFVSPSEAIFGAVIGYLFLWVIATGYKVFKKQEGMGLGDCKMLGMFGAWVGPIPLLNIIILSSVLALIVSFIMIFIKKHQREQHIPFGPYLAVAGWCTLIFGTQIMTLITQWV